MLPEAIAKWFVLKQIFSRHGNWENKKGEERKGYGRKGWIFSWRIFAAFFLIFRCTQSCPYSKTSLSGKKSLTCWKLRHCHGSSVCRYKFHRVFPTDWNRRLGNASEWKKVWAPEIRAFYFFRIRKVVKLPVSKYVGKITYLPLIGARKYGLSVEITMASKTVLNWWFRARIPGDCERS